MAREPRRTAGPDTVPTIGLAPDAPPQLPVPRARPGGSGTGLAAVNLNGEVKEFRNVDDEVKRGDLAIRQRFARDVMLLFFATNIFVMVGLGWLAVNEAAAIADKTLAAADRIVDAKVVMTLLGATTVQLGTVIFTIARAIFPSRPDKDEPTADG